MTHAKPNGPKPQLPDWLGIFPESRYTRRQWEAMRVRLELSTRQFQWAQCAFQEDKEAAMAARLGISASAVHCYRERLYRKLGVHTRAGAVEIITHTLDMPPDA